MLDQSSIANSWCAWHNYTWVGNSPISYTSMPNLAHRGATCGANKVHAGPAGCLDGVSILAGHEFAESLTDPFLNAWTDPSGDENGDKCPQWASSGCLRNVVFSTGTFAVQPQWSNYALQTAGTGCVFWS